MRLSVKSILPVFRKPAIRYSIALLGHEGFVHSSGSQACNYRRPSARVELRKIIDPYHFLAHRTQQWNGRETILTIVKLTDGDNALELLNCDCSEDQIGERSSSVIAPSGLPVRFTGLLYPSARRIDKLSTAVSEMFQILRHEVNALTVESECPGRNE